MIDQYSDNNDTFVAAGGQGQPYSTAGWNRAGMNSITLPQVLTFNTPAQQEFAIQLPSMRADYVDLLFTGVISNSAWAEVSARPKRFLSDYITRLRITDGSKNMPLDAKHLEVRAIMALAAPHDNPYVTNQVPLNETPGATAAGEIPISIFMRIWGPFQLAAMSRPTLVLGMAIADATSVALTVRTRMLASDIQVGEYALGYYYVSETRAPEAYNRIGMGASMVQDVFVFLGDEPGPQPAELKRIATANVPANQAVLYEQEEELQLIHHAGAAMIAGFGVTQDPPLYELLMSENAKPVGVPYVLEHVDIAHSSQRELVVQRIMAGPDGSRPDTIIVCRNQVVG